MHFKNQRQNSIDTLVMPSCIFFVTYFFSCFISKHARKNNLFWNLHLTASLGIASHILVTIEASDDAHGVFEFSTESLLVNGTEPEDGDSEIVLQVRKL